MTGIINYVGTEICYTPLTVQSTFPLDREFILFVGEQRLSFLRFAVSDYHLFLVALAQSRHTNGLLLVILTEVVLRRLKSVGF